MKLKEIMTQDVEIIYPDDSLQTAAQKMRDRDIGFLPVCDGDRLIGVVSDRDIVVRVIAEGRDPKAMMGRNLVSAPVIYCFEDQAVDEAARIMQENQIRRLVILSRGDKRLVRIVSLGDLATKGTADQSGEVLQSVSEPDGTR
jgi:CBS domain-containing protein